MTREKTLVVCISGAHPAKTENASRPASLNEALSLTKSRAGDEIRTRDVNLGKVALYH